MVCRGRKKLDEIVETSLRKAALWDEVKDRLKKSALGLSGEAAETVHRKNHCPGAGDHSDGRGH